MTYGVKYQFSIEATNGNEVDIFLLQRDYSGQKHIRALGRAPILKRERNGCILGTSLEIFAECRVDGEFAELYTSDAYEYKVEVYKRQILQWTGFVSPELYAEPDIAPPYDVQIIATDGLGELKNYDFEASARKSIMTHIRSLLQHTGLSLSYKVISDLQFDDDGGRVDAEEAFIGAVVDVDNLVGESSYDVLQKLLRSVGACITQQEGRWYLIRESDLYYRLEDVNAAEFGSMNSCDWWPVGNLNTDIMPAKNKIVITQENSYKDNILPAVAEGINGGWSLLGGVYYDRDEACNILPNEQSSMAYTLISADYPLRQPLMLTIKARCLTDIDGVTNSRIGIKVAAKGGVSSINASEFYLIYGKPAGYERYIPIWTAQSSGLGSSIVHSWEPPTVQFGDPDIEEINIQIPLSDAGNGYYAYAYAEELEITVFNPSSDYPICVYECSLTQYHRPSGLELTANIGNNAREVYGDTEVMLASGDASLAVTMYGILVADGSITKWYSGNNSAESLLQLLALDIARQVALPRMRYRGKLNVPSMAVPVVPLLFFRDGAYYFLNTYAYDLLNDELEVELISIPNANVAIESETMTEIASPGSASGTGVGGSGVAGGGNEPNLAGYATEEWVKEYVDAKTGPIDEKVETNITHIARAYTMIYELQDKDTAIDEALKAKTSLDDVKDYAKRFLSQAAFDPAKTHDYVVGSVDYSEVTDSAGAGGKALNLGIDLRIKDDIANAAEDDLDNGIFRNGLVTALGVKKYIDSLNLDQLTYDSVIGALGFTPLQASDLNGIDGRLTAIEGYFSSEEDADTLINKWNEIVAFLNATEGTTLDNILSSKADKVEIPTRVSQLENDKGYITSAALAGFLKLSGGTLSGSIDFGQHPLLSNGAEFLLSLGGVYTYLKGSTGIWLETPELYTNRGNQSYRVLDLGMDIDAKTLGGLAETAFYRGMRASINISDLDTYVSRDVGAYSVAHSGNTSALLVLSKLTGGSNTSVEIYAPSYNPSLGLRLRFGIDSNRYSDWRDFAFLDDTIYAAYKLVNSGGEDIVTINSYNNVIIGTSGADSANYKLYVDGDIRAKNAIKIGEAIISWDNERSALKIVGNVYATGQLAAGGFGNSDGGSGGGVILDYNSVVAALGFTPFDSDAFTKTSIKNALGIADWALAANKPSYNFSEIGSKPTTLAGYGITDALVLAPASEHRATTDNSAFATYAYGDNGWKVSGPVLAFSGGNYKGLLNISIGNGESAPTRMWLSSVREGTQQPWVEVLTDKNQGVMQARGRLAEADADTLSEAGVYEFWGGGAISNVPQGYSTMLVSRGSGQNLYFTSQLLTDAQGHLYSRMSEGYTLNWRPWRTILDDNNISSYAISQSAADSRYLKLIGGTVSGQIFIKTASGDRYFRAQSDSYDLGFGVGSGGVNRGIFDLTNNEWWIMRDGNRHTVIAGTVGIHSLTIRSNFVAPFINIVGEVTINNDAYADKFFRSKCSAYEIGFGVGAGNVNRGIFDFTNSQWWIVRGSEVDTTINGDVNIDGLLTANRGIRVASGQALSFIDAGGTEHSITYDSAANAFKVDGSMYALGQLAAGEKGEEQKKVFDISSSATSSEYVITHNFQTYEVSVAVYKVTPATGSTSEIWTQVIVDIEITSADSIKVSFGSKQSNTAYKVVVIG